METDTSGSVTDHTGKEVNFTSCDLCDYKCTNEIEMRHHVSEHRVKFADVPTTSNCGECDYTSCDDGDFENHMRSKHEFKCTVCRIAFLNKNLLIEHMKKEHTANVNGNEQKCQEVKVVKCPECDYTAESEWYLDDHTLDKHNFPCGDCSLILKSLERLRSHICKLPIKNPTFGSLYSKSSWDGNGCNPIFCVRKNQEVAWLHHEHCLSKVKTCHLAPNHLTEKDGIYHLEIDKYLIYCEIQWEALATKMSK